ncbi:MAG: ATP-binding protein [Opitutae bacterium]|nr:ATP-binding protein [Opitutae bacterium]MCD8299215.1 ATP-binding protein [Opitutae bacterium]
MKSEDKILFAFPLLLGALAIVVAGTLFINTRNFDTSYVAGEKQNLMTEAETITDVVRPMLANGEVAKASDYCRNFPGRATRITLVRADGTVLSDSYTDASALGNHALREEIALALTGTPTASTRFSATENARMIYCAVPVVIGGNVEYVLRLAIRNAEVDAMISAAKRSTWLALALGIFAALAVAFYILMRVRRPLTRLRESALRISRGDLDERISIPEKGVVREIAVAVSRMKEELKKLLDKIAAERDTRDFLFSSLSEAVLLFSESGEALYFNDAARKVFGIAPTVKRFDVSRCGAPELVRLASVALLDGTPIESEITLERAGTTRTLFAKGGIIFQDGERRLLIAVADLTNLRRLESFRSDFVANVSHEIKTPLTGIIGAAESLEDGAVNDPKAAAKFLRILSSQARRLNALVQDVLSLAAIERKQVSGEHEKLPFRLDAAVENAVNFCAPKAEEGKIDLVIRHNAPVEFVGDARLIEQAVINLVGNALKYSGSPRVEVSLEKRGGDAIVSVRDFGIGIAPGHQERIFERFYCVDKARSRELGGTGLGLAIVKHVAQLHGGNVSVESSIGKGATFSLALPLPATTNLHA